MKHLAIYVQLIETFTNRQALTKMESQDQKLQLTKVKTSNTGLTCYMANKIDIVILLKKTVINHHYLLQDLFNKIKKIEFCTSFFTCCSTLVIYTLWTDNDTTSEQAFLILIQENLGKLYISFNGGSSSNDIRVFSYYTYLKFIYFDCQIY